MQYWPNLEEFIANLLQLSIASTLQHLALTIAGCIFVCKVAKHCWEGLHGGDSQWQMQFEKILMRGCLSLIILNYWANPVPGLGFSVPRIVTGTADGMNHLITQRTVQDVITSLSLWQSQMESPGLANFTGMFDYGVCMALIWFMQAEGFLVNALALLAVAIGIVIGPLAICFMLWTDMEWMFRGWLRSFVQYSFLRPVISIGIYVIGNFVVKSMTAMPHGSMVELAENMPEIITVLLVGIVGIWKIPEIWNQYCSGSSGSSAGWTGAILAKIGGVL